MTDTTSFWFMQAKDWINILVLVATIGAIILGPIAAVRITERKESERRKSERQYSIFHKLMKTRRLNLHAERVEALNLIQLEFYGDEAIISAYKNYVLHLGNAAPDDPERRKQFFEEREDLFFDLIHEVGEKLGYSFDRRQLDKFSYSPQGWVDDQNEVAVFRKLMIELISGVRPLHVAQFSQNPKFPPPP
jgi:hypothetical protein